MTRRARWVVIPALVVLVASPAIAQRGLGEPVLHEPIPPDPAEDMALSLTVDGDLPSAIQTPQGLIPAPDPARPVGTADAPYALAEDGDAPGSTFRPDRDTRRPEVLGYDDPFSPSTAPFKRLSAYDSVNHDYTLSVRDRRTTPLRISDGMAASSGDEHFFGDMVVDLVAGERVRIPSVGPGARVLRARVGVGAEDVGFTLERDGADNWFIVGASTVRARLVMELSIPRETFGGRFASAPRSKLPAVAPLPPNVDAAAAKVAQTLGLSLRTPPREIVSKLVAWSRSFQESDGPLASGADIYLDLALQKRGVCRHRAFVFLVTSLHLGVPARMIANEAHAWVEVHDGRLWKRVDLGGAGRALRDPLSTNVLYEPPPDPFGWPNGASRGDDLAARARRTGPSAPGGGARAADPADPSDGDGSDASGTSSGPTLGAEAPTGAANEPRSGPQRGAGGATRALAPDDRPTSTLTMSVAGRDTHRGAPLALRGNVSAAGEPCRHLTVEIFLRSAEGDVPVGALATDDHGRYDGALVLPSTVPLGDYEVHARTPGDMRCGPGRTQ